MRKHWSHPDYGVTPCAAKGWALARVRGLRADTVVTINRTFSYDAHGGPANALEKARAARDQLLLLPEVQAYIAKKYAVPQRADTLSRLERAGQEKTTCPGLIGVWIARREIILKDGSITPRLDVCARVSKGDARGFRVRSWGVLKHGLYMALENAVNWRSAELGSRKVSAATLRKSQSAILKILGDELPTDR